MYRPNDAWGTCAHPSWVPEQSIASPSATPSSDLSHGTPDDEDVFDSVTWENEQVSAANPYDAGAPGTSGPGYRQSTADSDEGHGTHDPKWEGYLITSVKDPVKELAETN